MTRTRRFRVEKLIRDALPRIMRDQGLTVEDRRLGDFAYRSALGAKLVEEATEARDAFAREDVLEELADVSEVMNALLAAHNITPEEVEAARLAKREARGGFEGRTYNAAVSAPDGAPALEYYLARPDQYPDITDAPVRDIFLVRHCQSEANVGGVLEAHGDSPLTAMGRYQAGKLAERLAGLGLSGASLISSDLKRAAATAIHLAEVLGCDPAHDPRLREGAVGWLEGLTFEEVDRHKEEKGAKFISADLHGGETFPQIGERMAAAFQDHLAATTGPVVLVSHGYALRALLWRLYGGESSGVDKGLGNGDVIAFQVQAGLPLAPFDHQPLIL